MFQQIIINTPVWVWAILAFLLYRGIVASTDRETRFKKIFIIPAVMLGLSIQGIVSGFGANSVTILSWLASTVIGVLLTWWMVKPANIAAFPAAGTVYQRGSWIPLALMMGIFLTKYIVGVTLKFQPQYGHDAVFAGSICALYGLFNGIFIGKTLRIVAVYRNAQNWPQRPSLQGA